MHCDESGDGVVGKGRERLRRATLSESLRMKRPRRKLKRVRSPNGDGFVGYASSIADRGGRL